MQPRNILVPTDFSEPSQEAKDYAGMLADAFGAQLHVLHVIPDPLAMGWGVDSAYLPQMLERTEREVRERLETIASPGEAQTVPARVAIETGSPAERILEYARNHGIDLIVMGTQGRGAVERFWVGSVTERVLQRAPCPVVSVRRLRQV